MNHLWRAFALGLAVVLAGCSSVPLPSLIQLSRINAQTTDLALGQLKGEKVEGNGRLVVFVNAGVAPPERANELMPPLTCAFMPATGPEALLVKGPVAGVVVTDVDNDRLDAEFLARLRHRFAS